MAERFKAVVLKSTQPEHPKFMPLDEFHVERVCRHAKNYFRRNPHE
jgi:hypothetical protein